MKLHVYKSYIHYSPKLKITQMTDHQQESG